MFIINRDEEILKLFDFLWVKGFSDSFQVSSFSPSSLPVLSGVSRSTVSTGVTVPLFSVLRAGVGCTAIS